ncbi:MAG: glycosyltransferase family 2 protein [Phycisphaera sp.]|nr:MAG: glycosyltransferase family 2 protein [Phycisphaera sp.]
MTQHAHASSQANQRHAASTAPPATATPSVAVVMVTWNRVSEVRRSIESVLAQKHVDQGAIHLVVVDNASTDGTTEALTGWLKPERLVRNNTTHADKPAFDATNTGHANTAGLASVTLVRNTANLGGTGGFNTGFLTVEHILTTDTPIDFLWLLDDDAVADPTALASLLQTTADDPAAGLVGSRAVDIADRQTTYETTIYYDPRQGRMAETPHTGHRLRDTHAQWVDAVGDTRGDLEFAGVREVDVVSACSMLARWSVVQQVGYWDRRYFIYCDDADWCLRVGRSGSKVVCDLDAVVYHTPWFQKLTPTRLYYAERNAIWTMRKGLSGSARRTSTARWMRSVLRSSLAAGLRRRLYHAEILRKTASDAATNTAGRLTQAEPPHEPITAALERLNLNRADASLAFLCMTADQATLARDITTTLRSALGNTCPRPRFITRNDAGTGDITYAPSTRSRLRRQLPLLTNAPDACVVLNNTNDFPLLRCPTTLHIDHRDPNRCQVEHDSLGCRLAFFCRWSATTMRAIWYVLRNKPQQPPAPFG